MPFRVGGTCQSSQNEMQNDQHEQHVFIDLFTFGFAKLCIMLE